MSDVAYHRNRQGWQIKAMTPKAHEAMGRALGGPWRIAKEVYWSGIRDERFDEVLNKLRGMGLKVPARDGDGSKAVEVALYLA